jgi:hypothetical protein
MVPRVLATCGGAFIVAIALSIPDARGADCASSPTLACLAGRAGTANDLTLSLDAMGQVTGSDTSGFGLGLNPVAGSTLRLGDEIAIAPGISVIAPADFNTPPIYPSLLSFRQDVTFDSTDGPAVLGFWNIGSNNAIDRFAPGSSAVWDVVGENGIAAQFLFDISPLIRSESGADQDLTGFWGLLAFEPQFLCRGGGDCTAGDVDVGIVPLLSGPRFQTSEGSSLHVGRVGLGINVPRGDEGVTLEQNVGLEHSGVIGVSDGDVMVDVGLFLPAYESAQALVHASVLSADERRMFLHAGPGVFGSSSSLTNTSVALEVVGPRAFLPSRLTETQRDALSPLDGMIIYNTDDDVFQGYQNGSWVTFATY